VTLSLLIGAVVTLAILLIVLRPLFRPLSDRNLGGEAAPSAVRDGSGGGPAESAGAHAGAATAGSAIEILREIEFDRATGKLSDADYGSLRQRYTGPALAELRRGDGGASPVAATVTAPTAGAMVCPTCGPRPEADAQYCSSCARFLPGECAACGAPVTQPAARYCSGCGQRLAA
jgi:hypothetical protein